MNRKMIAVALAAGMTLCAFTSIVPQTALPTASLTAEATSVQEYNIPVTLMHYENAGSKSMGNPALVQMGKIVVDEKGNATCQISFQPMTYLGQNGYLGYLQKINDDGSVTNATVIEDSDTYDSNLKSKWYPKVVSIPVEAEFDAAGNVIGVKESSIAVQVYVPVMESLAAASGGGTQKARLTFNNALFTGSSVTLDGSVKLNTYFNFSDSFVKNSDAKIVISTPDGRNSTFYASEMQKGTETNQYYVPVQIPAKDMTTQLSAELVDGNGTVIDTFSTNIQTYAKSVIQSTDASSEYKTLAAELLNYGARAQVYFYYNYEGNANNLANSGLATFRKDTYTEVESSVFDSYTYTESGSLTELSYKGTALSFLSDITIRHYFELTSGNIESHKFIVNGTEQAPKYDETQKLYYVDIAGISAKNFATDYAVKIDDSYTLNYCVMDYCKAAQTAPNSTNILKNLTKALYKFWEAAKNM